MLTHLSDISNFLKSTPFTQERFISEILQYVEFCTIDTWILDFEKYHPATLTILVIDEPFLHQRKLKLERYEPRRAISRDVFHDSR